MPIEWSDLANCVSAAEDKLQTVFGLPSAFAFDRNVHLAVARVAIHMEVAAEKHIVPNRIGVRDLRHLQVPALFADQANRFEVVGKDVGARSIKCPPVNSQKGRYRFMYGRLVLVCDVVLGDDDLTDEPVKASHRHGHAVVPTQILVQRQRTNSWDLHAVTIARSSCSPPLCAQRQSSTSRTSAKCVTCPRYVSARSGGHALGGRYGRCMDAPTTLISIGGTGASLTVTVRRQETKSPDEPWFDTEITAEAFPFAGALMTVFTLSDLRQWGEALTALNAGTGRVVLGGGRAAELAIRAEPQVGAPRDQVALSVDLTPSGDDPYPRLTYLLFDVPPTWSDVGSLVSVLA